MRYHATDLTKNDFEDWVTSPQPPVLLDSAGMPLLLATNPHCTERDDVKATWRFLYDRVADMKGEPTRLMIEVPASSQQLSVPFEFSNLPIPLLDNPSEPRHPTTGTTTLPAASTSSGVAPCTIDPKDKAAIKANAIDRLTLRGWKLYRDRQFLSAFAGGNFTDTNPGTPVKDFWSDCVLAKVDHGADGHHECIYMVRKDELEYVGSLGAGGRYVQTGEGYHQLSGREFQASEVKRRRVRSTQ